jgi:hypothetical protein
MSTTYEGDRECSRPSLRVRRVPGRAPRPRAPPRRRSVWCLPPPCWVRATDALRHMNGPARTGRPGRPSRSRRYAACLCACSSAVVSAEPRSTMACAGTHASVVSLEPGHRGRRTTRSLCSMCCARMGHTSGRDPATRSRRFASSAGPGFRDETVASWACRSRPSARIPRPVRRATRRRTACCPLGAVRGSRRRARRRRRRTRGQRRSASSGGLPPGTAA